MTSLKILNTPDIPAKTVAGPAERRVELEQIVREHGALHEAVSRAEVAFETHDRQLSDRYLNPTRPAEIGVENDIEEQRRRSLRFALGESQLALAEFEKAHNMGAVQAELADIEANADARERAAARRKIVDLMAAFEADILQTAAERWAEIAQLGDQMEDRWPGQRLTTDLPHVPRGIFTPDGNRSLRTWFREALCLAEPGLFAPDDSVRVKVDAMKAARHVIIWSPQPLKWC